MSSHNYFHGRQPHQQQAPTPHMSQQHAPPPGPPPGHAAGPSPYPPPQSPYAASAPPYGAPAPPQGQYGAVPGAYGAPAPAGPYGGPPGPYGAPPGPHGAPPGPGYGAVHLPPTPPSMGYIPGQTAPMDMSVAADALRAAMKGFGTDEKALIRVLVPLDALQIAGVKKAYQQRHRRDLLDDVHSETSGYFRDGLEAIVRGPLDQDCHVLREALRGAGTTEDALNEVLLCRSNADMRAIHTRYHQLYSKRLDTDVRNDLSMKTADLFAMVLAANRAEDVAPVDPARVERDVDELYRCTEGRTGTDQPPVCRILTERSAGQLRAVAQAYERKYRRGLEDVVLKEFSGHMRQALRHIVARATDPARHDAEMLEEAMRGAGTKDRALVRRVVACHWDRARMQQCQGAYGHFYHRELAERVRGETSGDYQRLMVECVSLR